MSDAQEHREHSLEPATILVTASPAPGLEHQWEQALGELVRASLSFPGHLGTTVLKPMPQGPGQYRIITKFDSAPNMVQWRDSRERQRHIEHIAQFEAKPADIHYVTGLETWFELPHHAEAALPPPPKYKMAAIIWIAVYVTVLPLIALLKPVVSPLPSLLGSAILALISVAVMTWLVMPLLTALFRFWLYPEPAGPQLAVPAPPANASKPPAETERAGS
jgi:uncharacterized protein